MADKTTFNVLFGRHLCRDNTGPAYLAASVTPTGNRHQDRPQRTMATRSVEAAGVSAQELILGRLE
jgi:hypothetical protein